jgi:hypothetical protein
MLRQGTHELDFGHMVIPEPSSTRSEGDIALICQKQLCEILAQVGLVYPCHREREKGKIDS